MKLFTETVFFLQVIINYFPFNTFLYSAKATPVSSRVKIISGSNKIQSRFQFACKFEIYTQGKHVG